MGFVADHPEWLPLVLTDPQWIAPPPAFFEHETFRNLAFHAELIAKPPAYLSFVPPAPPLWEHWPTTPAQWLHAARVAPDAIALERLIAIAPYKSVRTLKMAALGADRRLRIAIAVQIVEAYADFHQAAAEQRNDVRAVAFWGAACLAVTRHAFDVGLRWLIRSGRFSARAPLYLHWARTESLRATFAAFLYRARLTGLVSVPTTFEEARDSWPWLAGQEKHHHFYARPDPRVEYVHGCCPPPDVADVDAQIAHTKTLAHVASIALVDPAEIEARNPTTAVARDILFA